MLVLNRITTLSKTGNAKLLRFKLKVYETFAYRSKSTIQTLLFCFKTIIARLVDNMVLLTPAFAHVNVIIMISD